MLMRSWAGSVSADVAASSEASPESLSAEQRRKRAQRQWWFTSILVPVLFLTLIFGVLAAAIFLHDGQDPPAPTPPPNPGPSPNTSLVTGELQGAVVGVEIAQAKRALVHLKSAQSEWSKLLEATLHDIAGKQIAGNEELLLRFIALRRMPSPLPSELTVTALSNELDSVTRDVQAGDAGGSTSDRLAEMKQQVFVAYAYHQARLDQLHRLRASAASLAAVEVDLFSAISMRAAELTNNVNAEAASVSREVQASLDAELEQIKKERDATASLVSELKSQLRRLQQGESFTAPSDKRDLQPLASRQEYQKELERIRTDLVAFTTPGYVQPESADKLVYHKTKQPMSYSALQRIGALDDDNDGRAILLRVAGSKSATQQNDRPLGSFPRMNSASELRKQDVLTRVTEAQRLLRQYGPFMVEDGLLAP